MATTDRTDAAAPAEALADRLHEAAFATLVARADGEALAAAGLLATACESAGTAYQVATVRTRRELETRLEAADESATPVTVGVPDEDGLADDPAQTAFEAAEALGASPDPAVALAGSVAGGGDPEDAPALADSFDRRPGIAAPTDDLADALAHTVLAHVECSGDPDAASAVVADVGEADAARRVASVLAIDAVTADGATERAAETVGRAIHPHAGGPLETVEGLADVLNALATEAPGQAIALALGTGSEPALAVWREHARAVHAAVRDADTERHAGLLVARTDGPVEAVARLLRDCRAPEPAVLAVGGGEAALATVETPAEPVVTAAEAVDGSGLARETAGYARFDADHTEDVIEGVREAV